MWLCGIDHKAATLFGKEIPPGHTLSRGGLSKFVITPPPPKKLAITYRERELNVKH